MSQTIRPAAVAGSFYSADAGELRGQIEQFLTNAQPSHPSWPAKALVAPHAGYVYSGQIAADGYAAVAASRAGQPVEKVVILGPTHRVGIAGIATAQADGFATPLGVSPVDDGALSRLVDLDFVVPAARVHADEHAIEVQLPFIQTLFGLDVPIVPLAVGDVGPAQVAEVIDRLWAGPKTLIVVSSDLSHYLGYEQAREMDAATIELILARHPVQAAMACGMRPLNGLLHTAARRGLDAQLVSAANSGDSLGQRSRVVGYASIIFSEVTP